MGTHSLILSFSHSFILSFSHSPILSFSHSLILPFSHSLILSFSHSPILSFSHSLILSFSHSLILSFSHSLTLSFPQKQIIYNDEIYILRIKEITTNKIMFLHITPINKPFPFNFYLKLSPYLILSLCTPASCMPTCLPSPYTTHHKPPPPAPQ